MVARLFDFSQSRIGAGNGWVKVGNAFCLILANESEVKSDSLSSRSSQEIFSHSLGVDGGTGTGCLLPATVFAHEVRIPQLHFMAGAQD